MRKLMLIATLAFVAPVAANAQMMYPQNTTYTTSYTSPGYAVDNNTQVLRLPQGYQPVAAAHTVNPNSDYPAQYPTYQAANRGAMMPAENNTQVASAAMPSARMLPQDIALTPTAQTYASMEPAAGTVTPVAMKVEVRPMAATISTDDGDSVQLRKSCDSQLNHRSRSKAINTSTTVQGDCLN